MAYGTNNPSNFGHSVGEINWNDPIPKLNIENSGGAVLHLRKDNTNEWFFNATPEGNRLAIRTGSDTAANEKLTILNNGKIGINNINPLDTFHVIGDTRIEGKTLFQAVKDVDGTTSTYLVDNRRYHVEVSRAVPAPRVLQLDNNIIEEFCRDEDGCTVSLATKDANGLITPDINSPFKMFISINAERFWDTSQGSTGSARDNDNSVISVGYGVQCYFTDRDTNSPALDNAPGFSVVNNHVANEVCILTIDD